MANGLAGGLADQAYPPHTAVDGAQVQGGGPISPLVATVHAGVVRAVEFYACERRAVFFAEPIEVQLYGAIHYAIAQLPALGIEALVGDGLLIDLKLSQTELGDLVATTRESINKQVRIWTEKDVLKMNGGFITIRDVDELERLAAGFNVD